MNSGKMQCGAAVCTPIGPYVRQQILDRLVEAFRIARKDLGGGLERLQELVGEVGDRLEALDLTRARPDERCPAQPSSVLSCAALSTSQGEPVREFLLIPFGEVGVERPIAGESFVFTREQAESARRWFEQMGRKLAIDYEHQSFDRFNTRPDGLRPAAGWIGGLEVRDDGLWAVNVTWTERAAELLRSGEYRYFSPVVFWTDEDHTDVAALGPVALTNDPAMRGVQALAAGRELDEEPGDGADGEGCEKGFSHQRVEESSHRRVVGFSHQRPSIELGAGGAGPGAEEEWVLRAELEAAVAEATLLRKQLAAQEADTFVERGLRLGKILDSTSMDWRDDYLRDPEATEQRLARAPVLLPTGRVVTLDRRGEVARLPQTGGAAHDGSVTPDPWRVTPEDLAAYEKATAAGRVVGVAV